MQSKPPQETDDVVLSPEEKSKVEVVPTPAAPVVAPPAPPTEVDYRGKFSNSTRENQILQGELEALNARIGEITKEEIPTDEEMKQTYPEYEYAEPLLQSVLKRQEVMDRRQKSIQMSVGTMLGSVSRRNEIAHAIASKAALAGKEDKFVEFASDPKRTNVPVDTLVSAFLYEVKDETPAPVLSPVTPRAPVTALERGTPTGGEAPLAPKIGRTDDELKELRTSNPREYNRLVREGKI